MTIVLLTVTRSPAKGGTRALSRAAAMQPPVAVPANGGPLTFALVTRPDGANVMTTLATPVGSPSLRHDDANAALVLRAAAAAARSKGSSVSAGPSGEKAAAGFGSALAMGSFSTGAAGSGFA